MGAARRHRPPGGVVVGNKKEPPLSDLVRGIGRDDNEQGWLCEEGEREGWDMNGRGQWGQRGGIDPP